MRRFAAKALAVLAAAALTGCTMASETSVPPGSGPDGLMAWPDLTGRPRPAADDTIRYGADSMQVVDLWLPPGRGPHPVVLMVHGGCWQTGIADRRLMDWAAADLRGRGIAVWNIDYRGVDRDGGGYPGTFADVAAAADALGRHAVARGLDWNRVVAVGHSAGGHLALWLAARAAWWRGGIEVRAELPGADPEEVERLRTEPIERVLRSLSGVSDVQSVASRGLSVTLARFESPARLERARARAGQWRGRLDFTVEIRLGRLPLPEGSPVTNRHPSALAAVISLGGLPDLEEAARPPGSGCGTEVVGQLIGRATSARPDVFADTSVPRMGPLGIPQVLINGEEDRIIPAFYAEDYRRKMSDLGDEVQVRMVDRTGHVELISPGSAAWAVAVEEIERALRR
ncbi:MAG TPA: alpha/beta fold hydrolase [Allosphingosinicella sp.]|jgi:acetyl esterase/lipase